MDEEKDDKGGILWKAPQAIKAGAAVARMGVGQIPVMAEGLYNEALRPPGMARSTLAKRNFGDRQFAAVERAFGVKPGEPTLVEKMFGGKPSKSVPIKPVERPVEREDAYRPPRAPKEAPAPPMSPIVTGFGLKSGGTKTEGKPVNKLDPNDLGLTHARGFERKGNEKMFEGLGLGDSEVLLTNRETPFENYRDKPPESEFEKTNRLLHETVRSSMTGPNAGYPTDALNTLYGLKGHEMQQKTAERGQDLEADRWANSLKVEIDKGNKSNVAQLFTSIKDYAPATKREILQPDGSEVTIETRDIGAALKTLEDKGVNLDKEFGIKIPVETLGDIYTGLDRARENRIKLLGDKPNPAEEKAFYFKLAMDMYDQMGRDKLTEAFLMNDPYLKGFPSEQRKLLEAYETLFKNEPKEKQ